MGKLFALASRNLFRNGRRTLITLAAIGFGLGLVLWTLNLTYGQYDAMTRGAISQLAGHVVVQADGWQEERDDAFRVEGASEVAASLAEMFPDAVITQRAVLQGLLVAPDGSSAVGLSAVDPEPEARVSDLSGKLVEGAWLAADDDRGILIGAAMAEALDVGIGDKLVYMGQHGGDEVASRLFRVRGVFRTGAAEMDGFLAIGHLAAAQELMEQPDTAHQIAAHFDGVGGSIAAAEQAKESLTVAGLEVLSWREAVPEVAAMIEVDKLSNHIFLFIIGVIVAMGVLNTVLMSVLERTREFGVMLSIGMRPHRVAGIVLLEGLVLGVLGSVSGLLFGLLMTWPTVVYGLDFGTWMGGESMDAGGVIIDTVIRAGWDVERMTVATLLTVIGTVLAAIWPAYHVAHLRPVDALKHV